MKHRQSIKPGFHRLRIFFTQVKRTTPQKYATDARDAAEVNDGTVKTQGWERYLRLR